jgi:hypothetical protein
MKLQHIVDIFHYCAMSLPVWDVIFATDPSSIVLFCVFWTHYCYLGPCSSQ